MNFKRWIEATTGQDPIAGMSNILDKATMAILPKIKDPLAKNAVKTALAATSTVKDARTSAAANAAARELAVGATR